MANSHPRPIPHSQQAKPRQSRVLDLAVTCVRDGHVQKNFVVFDGTIEDVTRWINHVVREFNEVEHFNGDLVLAVSRHYPGEDAEDAYSLDSTSTSTIEATELPHEEEDEDVS